MDYRERITIEPDKQGGKPCIRGLRITVHDVLSYLAAGMSEAEILQDFPELEPEDIRASLAFAADFERRLVAVPRPMSLPLKQVEAEALELPVHERARLAERLIASLDEEETGDLAEVGRAWTEEIERRVAQIESGAAELIPAEQVFGELCHRQRA